MQLELTFFVTERLPELTKNVSSGVGLGIGVYIEDIRIELSIY